MRYFLVDEPSDLAPPKSKTGPKSTQTPGRRLFCRVGGGGGNEGVSPADLGKPIRKRFSTFEHQPFSCGFPRQFLALRYLVLLRSRHSTFGSALLQTSRGFQSPFVLSVTLKAIGMFPDGPRWTSPASPSAYGFIAHPVLSTVLPRSAGRNPELPGFCRLNYVSLSRLISRPHKRSGSGNPWKRGSRRSDTALSPPSHHDPSILRLFPGCRGVLRCRLRRPTCLTGNYRCR